MDRRAVGIVLVYALVLAGCGDEGPPGAQASQMTVTTNNAYTWPNLCKRVTVAFTDGNGTPTRYGRVDTLYLTLTNAAAYNSNTCSGTLLNTLNFGPDTTTATFWVNSTTLGAITITVSGPLSAQTSLTNQLPTANLVLGQSNFTSGSANQGGSVSGSTMDAPFSTVRCQGKLFIADTGNNRVLAWNSTPTTNGQTADFVLGQASLTAATPVVSQTGMSAPQGVTCLNSTLYVADYANARILGYQTVPTTTGAPASFVWGQPNFTTNTAPAVSQSTGHTSGLALFGSGLIATDPTWHRALIWNNAPTAGTSLPDTVIGQASFTSTTPAATASGLDQPQNSRLSGGYLIVADASNNRVLFYNASNLSSGASASLVLGQSDFTSNTQHTSASGLYFPSDADFDGDHVIVADTGNNRMLIWNGMPTSNGQSADLVIGAANFTAGGSGLPTQIEGEYRQFTLDGDSMWVSDYNHRVLRFPAP